MEVGEGALRYDACDAMIEGDQTGWQKDADMLAVSLRRQSTRFVNPEPP